MNGQRQGGRGKGFRHGEGGSGWGVFLNEQPTSDKLLGILYSIPSWCSSSVSERKGGI